MRTDLEGLRGFFFVSFDTANEDEEAEDKEQEEFGGDVGLHDFDCLLDRGKGREELGQGLCWYKNQIVACLVVFTRDRETRGDQPCLARDIILHLKVSVKVRRSISSFKPLSHSQSAAASTFLATSSYLPHFS